MVRLSSTIWPFQRAQVGSRSLQRIFVRSRVDLEQQSTLLDESVVLHRQRGDRPVDLRSNADEVGEHLRVVGAGIQGGLVDHQQSRDQRRRHDRHAHNLSEPFALNRSFVFRHRHLLPIQLKNNNQIANVKNNAKQG